MKLLLTSNGLTNPSIADALEDLVGKPRKQIKIAFIPNAGLAPDDDIEIGSVNRDWFADNIYRISEFCGYFDIVSLSDLANEQVLERLEYADVIFLGGGDAFYLSCCMEKAGLFDELPKLLKTRVYAGISAGNMVVSPSLRNARRAIKNLDMFHKEKYDEIGPKGKSSGRTLRLVDFEIAPHLNITSSRTISSGYFDIIAEDLDVPLYVIDDNTAIKVVDGEAEVVSEGEWKLYDKH